VGAGDVRGSTEIGAEVEGNPAPDGVTTFDRGAADGTATLGFAAGVAARMDGVADPDGSTAAEGGTELVGGAG
jgi:hypothetical protein